MGTALITGASSGLGLEFAKLFAADGHSLVLVARRRDRLEQISAELKAKHPSIQTHLIDMSLSFPGAGSELFSKVESFGVNVDFLVNNAGVGTNGAFQGLPLQAEIEMMDLNMRTLVELTHFFLPGMIARRSGHILNVGSTAGFQPGPYMATYYASKAFVNSWSEALHEELKGTGVSCTLLAPGATKTEFAETAGATKSVLFSVSPVASSAPVAESGYRAMKKENAICIPGFLNRLLVLLVKVSPRFLVRKVASSMNKS